MLKLNDKFFTVKLTLNDLKISQKFSFIHANYKSVSTIDIQKIKETIANLILKS